MLFVLLEPLHVHVYLSNTRNIELYTFGRKNKYTLVLVTLTEIKHGNTFLFK